MCRRDYIGLSVFSEVLTAFVVSRLFILTDVCFLHIIRE